MIAAAIVASVSWAHCTQIPAEVVCEGRYPAHLQGIAGNGVDTLYWSFTTALVKTDLDGHILAKVEVPYHHGDLCLVGDRLYVAWARRFNQPDGDDAHVYIYDADDLSLIETVALPEVRFGAGGLDAHDGHFYVIGGLPRGYEENYVWEYTGDFEYVTTHVIPSGYTTLGIQTACCHDGAWWFGCYTVEGKKGLLKTDLEFNLLGIYDVSPAIGLVGWGEGHFLMGVHFGEQYQAKAVPMVADDERGLARDVAE